MDGAGANAGDEFAAIDCALTGPGAIIG